MLVWVIAPSAPTTIEATAVICKITRQSGSISANGPMRMRMNTAMAAIFGAVAKNMVTTVGAP